MAIVDTPVFQFVGRVLGVPHNPGYPAYVLLTHAYSYLPIGSLAYRMNLFSAVLGALAAAGVYVVSRQLGVRPVISVAAALGLAWGRVFWSQAIIAEVYTLNAATVVAIIAAILRWTKTRRRGWFYAAVALLALGLGNHTTIILFVPGLIAIALMTDARFSLRPATIGFVLLMAVASVGQYGFILLRSRTPGAYVESPARTVPQLVDVIRGKQFSDGLFAFSQRDVLLHRVPFLLRAVVAPELSIAGLVFAMVGLWTLLRRQPGAAALIGSGTALIYLFALNYDAVDIQVFLIPAFVCLWPCAAVAVDAALVRLPSRTAGVAATAILVAVVAIQLARNYDAVDESHDRQAAVYFNRLFEGLPDRSVFVHEDFLVDRMVMYELLGAGAAHGRRIREELLDHDRVLAAIARGETVLAFPKAADRLRALGIAVSYEPRRVTGEPLRAVLRGLPRGWTSQTGGLITIDGRELLRTDDGVAVALFDRQRTMRNLFVAESADEFRMPMSLPGLQVYPVLGTQAPHDHTQLLHRIDRRSDAVWMGRDDQITLFGAGWHAPEADRAGAFRRLSGERAVLTLPMRRDGVRLHIVAAGAPGGATLKLGLNSYEFQPREVREGWDSYDWLVPPGAAHAGDNELVFQATPAGSLTISAVVVTYLD